MNELERVVKPNYEPTYNDVLHTLKATTGLIQDKFSLKSVYSGLKIQ